MRQLASVQVVGSVRPVPGADSLDVATILGWEVVVARGAFKPGEAVVYCEIDSLLPERPEFEFLRQRCYRAPLVQGGEELRRGGFRIKTVKMRGQVSQGICFPLSILPELEKNSSFLKVGDDVTELLDVVHYEALPDAKLSGVSQGEFPSFIPRTDEIRVQNLGRNWNQILGEKFQVTEKLDGSSITFFALHDGTVGVCSRNRWLRLEDDNTFSNFAREHGILDKLGELVVQNGLSGLAVQGELIGPGIQKNRYGLTKHQVHLFNAMVVDVRKQPIVLKFAAMSEVAQDLGLSLVPVLETDMRVDADRDDTWNLTRQLVEYSKGKSALNPKTHREGVVFRRIGANDEKVGFKVINPDFLLKYDV